MSCGIYKITNQINGKVYIGQSSNIENRWREHTLTANNKDYYGHTRMLIYPAMKKYGVENFSISIIEECSIEQLDEREIYWISYYDATNPIKGYNLLSGDNLEGNLIQKISILYGIVERQQEKFMKLLMQVMLQLNITCELMPIIQQLRV